MFTVTAAGAEVTSTDVGEKLRPVRSGGVVSLCAVVIWGQNSPNIEIVSRRETFHLNTGCLRFRMVIHQLQRD
jgi:hypothetical protein